MLIISILIGLLMSAVSNQGRSCGDFPFERLLNGAPRREYRGLYVNRVYKYAVIIPKGLVAYDGRDEANHQGFGLALAEPVKSYIFVGAEQNSLEYEAPRGAATQMLQWMLQDGKRVESETISESYLGTLNAVRLEAKYDCPGAMDQYVRLSIVALSPDRQFIYELELYSPADRYESDRAVLDQILRSWKLIDTNNHRASSRQ